MEIVKGKPVLVKSQTLDLQEMRIIPIGDIQMADEEDTDIERLQKYVRFGLKQNAVFLGMGDYVDTVSPSNRAALTAVSNAMYDSSKKMLDEGASGPLGRVAEILAPTKGRWLGLLNGHHWWQFGDGTTSVSRLAEFLECPMLGDCGVILLPFKQGRKIVMAKLWAHHGVGSGMTVASPLNRLEHMTKTFYANVYLMGHQHKKAVAVIPWIDFALMPNGDVRTVGGNRYLVATGSFMRGYVVGRKNEMGFPQGVYPEAKMLPPIALGAPYIMIRPDFDSDPPRIDINVSV